MRSMIRGDDLDAAVAECLPELPVVVGRLERRIHLHQRTQSSIVVDVEEQMMRAGFGGDEVAVIGKELGFRAGGNVQHVEAMLVPVGKINRAARGNEGGLVIADAGMAGYVLRAGEQDVF